MGTPLKKPWQQDPQIKNAIRYGFKVSNASRKWPIRKPVKMGLLTESCGYGKTYWVEHGMVDEINEKSFIWEDLRLNFTHYEKKDVLFITTRRSILDQQLNYGEVVNAVEEDFSNSTYSWMEERDNKVRIITTSKMGSLFKEGKVEKMFPIVAVDELHSLYLDTLFAEESYHCIKCLEKFWDQTVKIGLTATPQILFDYLDKDKEKFFVLDTVPVITKYICEKTKYMNTYIEKAVKTVNPSPTEKVLVFCSSAKKAIELAEKREDGVYLISQYSKYEEAVKKQKPLYEYIVENNRFPDDVNILFMTSAYREGVEIKDDNITTIIVEASDEITINQFIGRVRSNVKTLVIVFHDQQLNKWKKNIEEFQELKKGTRDDLLIRYTQQKDAIERNESTTLMVQKVGDDYVLNEFFEPIMKYLIDCYNQAMNDKDYVKLVSTGDRPMETTENYITGFLNGYCEGPIFKTTLDKERANWDVVNEYLDRRLYGPERNELCEKINWIDTNRNRVNKWHNVKEELIKQGYTIVEKKSGTNYAIISKPQEE